MNIENFLQNIMPLNNTYFEKAMMREENLIKPPHSLGELENIACKICGIREEVVPYLKNKRLLVFASDNGVFEEGVSSCPQNITIDQTINLTRKITGASSMAKFWDDDIEVYDLGVNADIDDYIKNINKKYNLNIKNNVIDKKISYSTKNILKEPAMSEKQMNDAIQVGIDAVEKAKKENIDILGVGEMGICNTTTSTAILSVISGEDVNKITGRGAGLTDDAYKHKIEIITKSINRVYNNNNISKIQILIKKILNNNTAIFDNGNYEKQNLEESDITFDKNLNSENNIFETNNIEKIREFVFNILHELGGYDIAAMVGAYIGAGYYKIPIVVDGIIGVVAALLAVLLNINIKNYLFLSHQSMEPGYKIASNLLNLKPMFDLGMRLGEGSGCIIAWRIIDSALAMHNEMKTFDEVNIDDSYLDEIR